MCKIKQTCTLQRTLVAKESVQATQFVFTCQTGKAQNMDHLLIKFEEIKKEKQIGQGGYGSVWHCIWTGKGGDLPVAVKFLQLNTITKEVEDEFYKEVQIMRYNKITSYQ